MARIVEFIAPEMVDDDVECGAVVKRKDEPVTLYTDITFDERNVIVVEQHIFSIGEWEKKDSMYHTYSMKELGPVSKSVPSFTMLKEAVLHPTLVLKTSDLRLQSFLEGLIVSIGRPRGWGIVLKDAIGGNYSVVDRFSSFCSNQGVSVSREVILSYLIKCMFYPVTFRSDVIVGCPIPHFFSRFFLPIDDSNCLSVEESFLTQLLFGTMSGWLGFCNAACSLPGGEEFTALSVSHFEPLMNMDLTIDINICTIFRQPSLLMKVVETSELRRFFCSILSVSPVEHEHWVRSRVSGTPFGEWYQVGDLRYAQYPIEFYEQLCLNYEIVLDQNKLPVIGSEILCNNHGKIVSVADRFFCSSNYFVFSGVSTFIAIMDGRDLVWLNGSPPDIDGLVSIDLPDDESSIEFNINYRPFDVMSPSESYLVHLPCTLWGFDIYCNMNAPLPICDIRNEVSFPGQIDGQRTLEILLCLSSTCYLDVVNLILESCGIVVSAGCSLVLNQNYADLPPIAPYDLRVSTFGCGLIPFREHRVRVFSGGDTVCTYPGTSLCSYGCDGVMVSYYNHEICLENMECDEWNSFYEVAVFQYGDDRVTVSGTEQNMIGELDYHVDPWDVSTEDDDHEVENHYQQDMDRIAQDLESDDEVPDLLDAQEDNDLNGEDLEEENDQILVLDPQDDQEQPPNLS